jgi:hypothetical protein
MVNRTGRLPGWQQKVSKDQPQDQRIRIAAIRRSQGNQMTESKRFNFAARLVVITLSSITMLWLLWRFPIPTYIGSVVLLGCLLHGVRIARVVDVAVGPNRDLPLRAVRRQCPGKGDSPPHSLSAKSTSGAR